MGQTDQFRKGEVQAAIEELNDRGVIEFLDEGNVQVPIAILPSGTKIQDLKQILDGYKPHPDRMAGHARFTEIQSLAEYVNKYKTDETIIYIDDRNKLTPNIEVVFDEHQAADFALLAREGDEPDPSGRSSARVRGLPSWREFRASYGFPLTPEWQAWVEVSGRQLEQRELAAFLEDHVLEVIDPSDPGEVAKRMAAELGLKLASGATLLKLSRGLQVNVDQKVTQVVDLTSGEGQISFEETHKDAAGGKLNVPGAFAIALPVFRGGELFRIAVRLKYRVTGGRVLWTLMPHRLDQVFEAAIEGAAKQLRELTAMPVLRGIP